MQLSNTTVLITGATSGIGRALAERLARRGNRVLVTGRRQALLDEVAAQHPDLHGVHLDVNDPQSVAALVREVESRFGELDVLINNAGIMQAEDLTAIDLERARGMLETNVMGVLRLTEAFLPLLLRRPQATLVTTTSGLASVPKTAFPTYSGTKAFLHSWLQSLRWQLRETAVEVLELAPPRVQTELTGPEQATDPNAMPLDAYADEVLELLERGEHPEGEVLVQRVRPLRHAERDGSYAEVFALLNPEA